jgi:hypothetical protein
LEDVAERQYSCGSVFSNMLGHLGTGVGEVRPSINAAYRKHAGYLVAKSRA